MQTPDKKLFRDMQEHPEKYSDQEIEAMMDDLDQMPDIDMAWQEFNHRHTAIRTSRRWLQIAASVIGVIMVSGIALAAIHIVRHYQRTEATQTTGITAEADSSLFTLHSSFPEDTIAVEPRVFDNVPLDTMLHEMAIYYRIDVEFQREETRQLRLHFEWKRNESLDRVLKRLNNFEAVNIIREPEKLIVR